MSETTTSCYTFQVSMLVQVLADSKEAADQQLSENSGYVSHRNIELVSEVPVHSELKQRFSQNLKIFLFSPFLIWIFPTPSIFGKI